MEEVEAIIRNATEQFGSAEELYLLHSLTALKYRELKNGRRAYEHFCRASELIKLQVPKGPFYVEHFAYCLKEMDALSGTERRNELLETITKWRGDLSSCLYDEVESIKSRQICNVYNLKTIRLYSQALVVANGHLSDDEGESALLTWSKVLVSNVKTVEDKEAWIQEVYLFANEVARALGPHWLGEELEKQCVALVRCLNECGDRGDPEVLRARHAIGGSLLYLAQHQRLRGSFGTKLFDKEMLSNANPSEAQFLFVHLTSPSTAGMRDGIRSVLKHRKELSQAPVLALSFMAPQTKVVRKEDVVNHEHSPDRVRLQQEEMLAQFSSDLNLPSKCLLLERSIVEKLAVKVLPISLLIDRNGYVVCALTGSGEQSVDRLIWLARSKGATK